jgi:NuA3 HAT complex component NTO1
MVPQWTESNIFPSLDKDVFKNGLAGLQAKLEERFYATTLPFWQDLCNVIHEGINTDIEPDPLTQHKYEPMDGPSMKKTYSDIRQRKALGKRILKTVQAQVEKALRMECDISSKPYDDLHKELLSMIEACFEIGQRSITAADGDGAGSNQDVIMVDVPNGPEITVAGPVKDEAKANGHTMNETNDMMEAAADLRDEGGNIEVKTSSLVQTNGLVSSSSSVAGHDADGTDKTHDVELPNGIKPSATPPSTNGYVALPRINPPAPPTPPQSNGSFGKEAPDILTEGGIPWYLKPFEPRGLSVVEEQWAGKDIVRGLSEDLTDIDDDELKGLGLDVNGGAIMAAPATNLTADTIISAAAKSRASRVKKRASTSRRRR